MFNVPVVRAWRFLRTLRGQTGAQLLSADDGHCYAAKFSNNPMGVRILVNELVSALLLRSLEILTPEVALVSFDEEALENNPEIGITTATGRIAPQFGVHFGSRHPGPDEVAIYDFLPDKLVPLISNRDHFLGALVFDRWVGTLGYRQAIFYRQRASRQFVAEMIGHALSFGGQDWRFRDCLSKGFYLRKSVYPTTLSFCDLEPWLDKIMALDPAIFESLADAVPRAWIAGQERQFCNMLCLLENGRERLPKLLNETVTYFQNHCHNSVAVEQSINQPSTPEECVPA
jgi:hypothetical protein